MKMLLKIICSPLALLQSLFVKASAASASEHVRDVVRSPPSCSCLYLRLAGLGGVSLVLQFPYYFPGPPSLLNSVLEDSFRFFLEHANAVR